MTAISRRAWATINSNALRKNLAQVRSLCPGSKIYPVIKSNAYGHGMAAAAKALAESHIKISGLAVATMNEAIELRQLQPQQPIMLLNGFMNEAELRECLAHAIEPVVPAEYQLEPLEKVLSEDVLGENRKFWVKYNTGMNRLGLSKDKAAAAYLQLHKFPNTELVLMSHLACADDPDDFDASEFTNQQLQQLLALRGELVSSSDDEVELSMAASAGILQWSDTHLDYVRPAVMLYGSSPMAGKTGEELGLQPVMTLKSRLIAINFVEAGQSIGYNATYTCEQDTRVGVVSIGYGDGYPRSAENGTPVLVKTASGTTRTRLIGRVSMDMITIDLSDIDDAKINDEVILWGEGLCADEVAKSVGTISYELFCKVTKRVSLEYVE